MTRLYGTRGWAGPTPQQTIRAHEPPQTGDVWLTLRQASDVTGISSSHLGTLAREGLVRAKKERGAYGGVRWMVERGSMLAWNGERR